MIVRWKILASAVALAAFASPGIAADKPVVPPVRFAELPLGAVKPQGWLKAQLQIQRDGLGGHLDEFWPDIKDSSWIGGKAEGWERAPYWLDGAIPLAFLLDDEAMKQKVKTYVDYILTHQTEDGWLGPVGDNDPNHKPYDVWPLFVIFKAFRQYQEASGDPRIIPALLRATKKIDAVISKEPLYSWAHYRGADLMAPLFWLHEKTGDRAPLALAEKIARQSYDWRHHFEHFDNYREKTTKFGLENHGVNNGMGLKFAAARYRLNGDPKDRDAIFPILATLDRYHGQATGSFSCDEHYAGRSPSQGTELCTVAESMYSLELVEGLTGDVKLGDRLEKLAFNAFPATFKKDMTAHQYDQQVNQVVVKVSEPHVYTNNGPDSNLYGLEPNFGCCTANMHQGWPKFTSHLWAKSDDGGLAALAYAPSTVETSIAGKPIKIELKTDYPFADSLSFEVTVPEAMKFPIHLRIPAWATSPVLVTEGQKPEKSKAGEFFRLDRAWPRGTTRFVLRFGMGVSLYQGVNDAVAIERGPLLYALKIGAEWKKIRGTEPFADYEVHPTTPWNYTIRVDREHPEHSVTFASKPVGKNPFSQDGAPVTAIVKGRRLPSWTLEKNAAAPPPKSPVEGEGPVIELQLIPYGCTDLRVAEFPNFRP